MVHAIGALNRNEASARGGEHHACQADPGIIRTYSLDERTGHDLKTHIKAIIPSLHDVVAEVQKGAMHAAETDPANPFVRERAANAEVAPELRLPAAAFWIP